MRKAMRGFAALAMVGVTFRVGATDFPEPVGGVLTLTEAGTYAAALPSGTTALVVDVGGTATLSADLSAYTGTVVVKTNSTLAVNNTKASLAASSSITVENGGSFFPTFNNSGQNTCAFKKPIYIAGKGNGGSGGAFAFKSLDGGCPDSVVTHLVLTDDATIDCASRWGVSPAGGKGLIDLQGHTLTLTGKGQFLFFSASLTPGKLVSKVSTLTFQTRSNAPYALTGDATNTVIEVQSGVAAFWSSTKPLPYKVVFNGGWLCAQSGNRIDYNTISGPVEINKWITSYTPVGKSLTLAGPIALNNAIQLYQADSNSKAGTLYVTGKVTKGGTKDQKFHASNDSTIVLQAADIGNPQAVMQNGTFVFDSDKGDLDMFRCANGAKPVYGVFRQVKGDLSFGSWDNIRIGEGSRSFGAYVLEGGVMRPSHDVYVAKENANAHGFFLQRGGLFKPTGGFYLGCANTEAFFVQTGGTNTTHTTAESQAWRVNVGATGGSNIVFSVSGSNTLFETDTFFWGDSNQKNPIKAVFSAKDGARFKANRFFSQNTHPAGMHVTLWLDGGIVYPTMAWGWCAQNGGTDAFYKRAPERTIVGAKGAFFDMSECSTYSECPLTLEKPEGEGIASIALPTDVEGFSAANYHGPVPVEIVGPSGSFGASAYADYDFTNKTLTGIVVLSPGCNYDATTKIYLRSPNADASYLCSTFALTGAQTCGGVTKRGAKELRLYNTCTYTGGTTVEGGALSYYGKGAVPADTPVTVKKGATLNANSKALKVTRLAGQGTIGKTSGVTVSEALDLDADAIFAADATPLSVGASLTFASGAVVNLTCDAAKLETYKAKRAVAVLKVTSGSLADAPKVVVNGTTSNEWRATIRNNTLFVGWPQGEVVILR